jgi:hypothetical protein
MIRIIMQGGQLKSRPPLLLYIKQKYDYSNIIQDSQA